MIDANLEAAKTVARTDPDHPFLDRSFFCRPFRCPTSNWIYSFFAISNRGHGFGANGLGAFAPATQPRLNADTPAGRSTNRLSEDEPKPVNSGRGDRVDANSVISPRASAGSNHKRLDSCHRGPERP